TRAETFPLLALALTLSPDGQRVAKVVQDVDKRPRDPGDAPGFRIQDTTGEARVWDVATGKLLRTAPARAVMGTPLVFRGDGKGLAFGYQGQVHELNLETKDPPRPLVGPARDVLGLAYSSDGKSLAAGADDKTIWIWNTASGLPVTTLRGHSDGVAALAWSPDGKQLASASGVLLGGGVGEVKLWDPTAEPGVALYGQPATAVAFTLAVRPDGRRWANVALGMAGGQEDHVTLHRADGKPLPRLQPSGDGKLVPGNAGAFSPDGRWLAILDADQVVRV